jgi:hypothetical protein
VLSLLRQAGPDGAKVEKELRRLLPLKTKAEYEPDDVAPPSRHTGGRACSTMRPGRPCRCGSPSVSTWPAHCVIAARGS